MSNSDWHQRVRQEAEAITAAGSESQEGACKAGNLKGLLHAIVDQISDADRRHSETLSLMQDRLSAMGHDARHMRSRVPDSFQPAFERIEAGMSELASRIADVNLPHQKNETRTEQEAVEASVGSPAAQHYPPQTATQSSAPVSPAAAEPPMALRSALDHNQQTQSRKRDEEVHRGYAGVDTFDVIESLPGNVTDPWDRDSAEALAGLYDPVDRSFKSESPASAPEPEAPHAYQAAAAFPAAPVAPGTADHAWFESRFSEIASHIDRALADVRPDELFFAIGQRLDQFERQFGQAFENVATRGDVESVRLIEAHMSELVGHLENTNSQLARLDALENQIAGIAEKLEDVHRAALGGAPNDDFAAGHEAVDVAAIAKAAAREAASHFAAMPQTAQPGLDVDEMRSLFERTMSEVRLGDENTTVLLDTLQQAMIRLLDRVDAIELNQHRSAQMPPQAPAHNYVPDNYVPEHLRFNADPGRSPQYEPESQAELDAAVAAVASAKSNASPFQHAPGNDYEFADEFAPQDVRGSPAQPSQQQSAPARSADKLRQDFIADARRAKMRLANENAGQSDEIIITKPDDSDAPKAAKMPAKASAKGAATVTKPAKEASGSALSPRVVALGLALAVVGGAWFFMPGFSSKRATIAGTAKNSTLVSKETGSKAAAASAADKAKAIDGEAQAPGAKPSMAPPPDADFAPQSNPEKAPAELNLHSTTFGQIVPGESPMGSASVPMQGITVSTDQHVEAADIERARRQHAMASVSSNLGLAAGEMIASTQAALAPDTTEAATAQPAAPQVAARTPNGPLDMPPATVGPLSLRLAAANGDPSAEFEVGAQLAEGKGTTQNFKDAAKWYQRSASKGFVQAQYRLGTLYERGLGVKADQPRAEDWYMRAAEQGNVKAMHNLAVLSANKRGGSPDYARSASWFSKAAEYGLADSQFNLAVLYENGLGVPEDLKLAYKWLSLAARSGDKEAVRRRDILKGKLPAADLSAAEGFVATYKAATIDKMANDARTAGEAWKHGPSGGDNG